LLKLMGSLMVVASSTLGGRTVATSYSKRPKEINDLLGALQILETQILYSSIPLPEALKHITERVNGPIGSLFKEMLNYLDSDNGTTVGEAWEKGILAKGEVTALQHGDLEILKSLGKNIGISDRLDQEKHLKLTKELLKLQYAKADDLANKNVKIWNYLGFAGGLVLVLLTV
jgi:stage III sporulation protein AB